MPNKKPIVNMSERRILKVSIFNDEFEALGITPEMVYNEAVTLIRAKLELPERYKLGSMKSKIRNALKEATNEQVEQAYNILSENKE